MKTRYVIGILATILVVAMLTNPGTEGHKEEVRSKLNAYLQKTMKDDGGENAFANFFAGTLVDRIVDNTVTSNNYIVFSLTEVTWDGESKPIGFGALGNVWLSKKITESLEKNTDSVTNQHTY